MHTIQPREKGIDEDVLPLGLSFPKPRSGMKLGSLILCINYYLLEGLANALGGFGIIKLYSVVVVDWLTGWEGFEVVSDAYIDLDVLLRFFSDCFLHLIFIFISLSLSLSLSKILVFVSTTPSIRLVLRVFLRHLLLSQLDACNRSQNVYLSRQPNPR